MNSILLLPEYQRKGVPTVIIDEYATKAEAASIIGVDVATIGKWMVQGKLTFEKVGREILIRREQLAHTTRSTSGRKSRVRPEAGTATNP